MASRVHRLNRWVPVRVSLVVLAIAVYVFAVLTEGYLHVSSQTTAQALLGLLAAAILGDAYRPSGTITIPSATPPDEGA